MHGKSVLPKKKKMLLRKSERLYPQPEQLLKKEFLFVEVNIISNLENSVYRENC
jgi:hypothetical protein